MKVGLVVFVFFLTYTRKTGIHFLRERVTVLGNIILPKYMACQDGNNFLKDFIYLFLERGREGERDGEKHQCVVAS